uniref:Uncharacterized protein n=1 Tax=Oryza glumipatula TaxID=40148 RepID=A0A0D9YS96_9ORYZ
MLLEKLLLSPVHNDTYKFIRFQDEKISAYILSNKIKHELIFPNGVTSRYSEHRKNHIYDPYNYTFIHQVIPHTCSF